MQFLSYWGGIALISTNSLIDFDLGKKSQYVVSLPFGFCSILHVWVGFFGGLGVDLGFD